jgi:hypothetical protein
MILSVSCGTRNARSLRTTSTIAVQKGFEFGLRLRFLCLFAANPVTARSSELKPQGRNVPSAWPRRALPAAQSVSKISPTSAALARAKRLAISRAVPGSSTAAKAGFQRHLASRKIGRLEGANNKAHQLVLVPSQLMSLVSW